MPRPNQRRTIASEANLARRIAFEREQRGLSYEALARQMTEAGCSMQGSAIYRIEKGDPPRRVTVDELVAFSRAFSIKIEDMLEPMELVEQRRAKELVSGLNDAGAQLVEVIARMVELETELRSIGGEIFDYVDSHLEGSPTDLYRLPQTLVNRVAPMTDGKSIPLAAGLAQLLASIDQEAGLRHARTLNINPDWKPWDGEGEGERGEH